MPGMKQIGCTAWYTIIDAQYSFLKQALPIMFLIGVQLKYFRKGSVTGCVSGKPMGDI